MKKYLTFLGILFLFCTVSPESANGKAKTDERLELMGIVYRLAGAPEWKMKIVPENYAKAIDGWFGPYKDHPAVEMAKHLRFQRKLSFGNPPAIALYTDIVGDSVVARPGYHIFVDWLIRTFEVYDPAMRTELDEFLVLLTDFYRDTRFREFYSSQQDFYRQVTDDMDALIDTYLDLDWLAAFKGHPDSPSPQVYIGCTNGGANYALAGTEYSGKDQCAVVQGVLQKTKPDDPYFIPTHTKLDVIVHESAHILFNPYIYENAELLAPPGEIIFPLIEELMRKQAYPDWFTVLYESLTRAVVIQYFRENPKAGIDYKDAIRKESELGYFYMDELVGLLDEYSRERSTYPTFDDFMPRIVDYFRTLSDRDFEAMFRENVL